MYPIFEPGDIVILVNHWEEMISDPMTVLRRIETSEGFMYLIEGITDSAIPEELMRFYDETFDEYWEYEEDFESNPAYDPFHHQLYKQSERDFFVELTSEKTSINLPKNQPLALPKPQTTDDLLDAYNTLMFLEKTTGDTAYKKFAEEIIEKMKKKEHVDLDKFARFLGEEAE